MGIDPAFLNEWRNFFKGVVFKDTNVFIAVLTLGFASEAISLLGREGAVAAGEFRRRSKSSLASLGVDDLTPNSPKLWLKLNAPELLYLSPSP